MHLDFDNSDSFGYEPPIYRTRTAKERVKHAFRRGLDRMDVIEVAGFKMDTATSARFLSWKEALRDWIAYPFLRYGVTGYRFVDAQYVRVLTETGLLGFITFFLLHSTIFCQAHAVFRGASDPFEKGLSMGFLAGFIGLLFHAVGANTFIIVRIMEPF